MTPKTEQKSRANQSMLNLSSVVPSEGCILFIGAHCDDIEIGCGGTLLRLASEFPDLSIRWVVFSSDQIREEETKASAAVFLKSIRDFDVQFFGFRNGFFPEQFGAIKEQFERIKDELRPALLFTHYRFDLHQDHKVLSDLSWNTFRNETILEYEILKYDGDLGHPNFFVTLPEAEAEGKAAILMKCYKSQHHKQWFGTASFMSMLRIRGVQCNSPTKFAEGFYARKILVGA